MSQKPSPFRFREFKILKSSIDFVKVSDTDFDIEIIPQGQYSKSSKTYTLNLELRLIDDSKFEFIVVGAEAKFTFDKEFNDEIPSYFTVNAPAIAFPYIRSYIAALSALSGIGTVNLPILNLVDLGEKLKNNFSILD